MERRNVPICSAQVLPAQMYERKAQACGEKKGKRSAQQSGGKVAVQVEGKSGAGAGEEKPKKKLGFGGCCWTRAAIRWKHEVRFHTLVLAHD